MRIDILLEGIFIIAFGFYGIIMAFRDRKKFLGEMTETVNAVVDKVYYRWSRSGTGYFVVWKYSYRGKRYTSEELATAFIVPEFEVGEKRKILVNPRNPGIVSGSIFFSSFCNRSNMHVFIPLQQICNWCYMFL